MRIKKVASFILASAILTTFEGSYVQAMDVGNEKNSAISGDLQEDVQNGMVYFNSEGQLVDSSGNLIQEYSYITMLDNGTLYDGDSILEGYYGNIKTGQVGLDIPEAVDYGTEDLSTPQENIKTYASESGVATGEMYVPDSSPTNSLYTFPDDGNYFDEVVLGTWDSTPWPEGCEEATLPRELANKLYNCGIDTGLEDYSFVNGEDASLDDLRRSNPSSACKALILLNIQKLTNDYGDPYFSGTDYFTGEQVAVNGKFNKLVNGDDLLLFTQFSGLAMDDTINFDGGYFQLINDKNLG